MSSEKRAGATPRKTDLIDAAEGQVHDVDELRNKGIKKVRVVGMSHLHEMAREAAARAVLELAESLEVTEQVRRSLVGRAQEAILGGPVGPVPQVIEKPALQPDVKIEAPSSGVTTSSSLPIGPQDHEMLQELSKLIARDWRSELNLVQDSHRAQVERLEMRIEELTRALRATDQVLTRGREDEGNEDPVLKPFDHKKEELLDQLFQANVALREISPGAANGKTVGGEGRTA